MKTGSAISVLALLASALLATAQNNSPSSSFLIEALGGYGRGHPRFNGDFLSAFHTGAGQASIVTTPNINLAITWLLEETALLENATSPLVLSLSDSAPYLSDAPAGYKVVSLQVGTPAEGTTPFSVNTQDSTNGVTLGRFDYTFVLCNVNATAPYPSSGPQSQLLWRQPSQTTTDTRSPPRCADVSLQAVDLVNYKK